MLHTAKPESLGASLSVRARSGGFLTQLAFAGAHLGVHLGAAICLMLLLELATETFIRCESISKIVVQALGQGIEGFGHGTVP